MYRGCSVGSVAVWPRQVGPHVGLAVVHAAFGGATDFVGLSVGDLGEAIATEAINAGGLI